MRRSLASWCLLLILGCLLASSPGDAATDGAASLLRFDMFLGHDNVVPDFGWFPVTFEVKNDGPPFIGTVKVGEANFGAGASRSTSLELPTGTLKRFSIPMFKSEGYQREWKAVLLDSNGRSRAEASRLARRRVPWNGLMIGALARTSAGAPSFPSIEGMDQEIQPAVGRLLPELFPDNPLLLESLRELYLSSEKALTLKAPQVNAIVTWLYGGGHLVVNLDQLGDLSGLPWLRRILPTVPTGTAALRPGRALHNFSISGWPDLPAVRKPNSQEQRSPLDPSLLEPDATFDKATLPVWKMSTDGLQIDLADDPTPLIVSATRGWGRISLLAFNPEREPFASWEHRSWFWGSLCGGKHWLAKAVGSYSYRSTDGVFGALVDSTQIRKLPVGWLLVLLVTYLFVIGPFDRWWLRRINREMLTWITFPCYVALFSGLIYLIGYRLRAGETEWNEVQMVDVIPFGDLTQWRVRSFGSVYSPSNRRYGFSSRLPFSTFRPEAHLQGGRGGQDDDSGSIAQLGEGYKANVPVPVWTSQLFVQDGWTTNAAPIRIEVSGDGRDLKLRVDNQSGQRIEHGSLIHAGRLYEIKDIATGTSEIGSGQFNDRLVADFVSATQARMNSQVDNRRQAFGRSQNGEKTPPRDMVLFASLSGAVMVNSDFDSSRYTTSPGVDLSPHVRAQEDVFLAWIPDHIAIPTFNDFEPRRTKRFTCYRLVLPRKPSTAARP